MHATDAADGLDGAVESHDHLAELGGAFVVEGIHVDVLARLEEHLHRHADGIFALRDPPVVVDPDARVVARDAAVTRLSSRFARARQFGVEWWADRLDPHVALERKDRPIGLRDGSGFGVCVVGHTEVIVDSSMPRLRFSAPARAGWPRHRQ